MPSHGKVIWLTGLSGSGKTTLSRVVAEELSRKFFRVHLLDGDSLRQTLSSDLGYSLSDRFINVKRATYLAKMLADHEIIVLVAVIAPLRSMRLWAKATIPELIEVFTEAPLEICEARDPKGLYKKARAGLVHSFTGIDSPFEPPDNPDLICHTATESVVESATKVLDLLSETFPAPGTSFASQPRRADNRR